eukprot:gene9456-11602_t
MSVRNSQLGREKSTVMQADTSSMYNYLDFEKPVADLDGKILELKKLAEEGGALDTNDEIARLEKRSAEALRDLYRKLTPWQKAQIARHPDRPHCVDYIGKLFTDFTPLAGDRNFAEDEAIQAGLARFNGQAVAVIGQEKGNDTKSRLKHNFGMAMPEGYRKAVRVMDLADRFNLPVITLVDTAGAFPGIAAEERGQAEAIARSTAASLNLKVPMVSVIIGEGGSGGAIAIATANRVYMLEHAIYSVISPEGAASILWHDSTRAKDAATNMRITAQDLYELKIIDGIIPEPTGGAHRGKDAVIEATGNIINVALKSMASMDGEALRKDRRDKFLAIGHAGAHGRKGAKPPNKPGCDVPAKNCCGFFAKAACNSQPNRLRTGLRRRTRKLFRQPAGPRPATLILGQGLAEFADQHGNPHHNAKGQQMHPDRCRIMQVLFVVILVVHGFVLAWGSGARSWPKPRRTDSKAMLNTGSIGDFDLPSPPQRRKVCPQAASPSPENGLFRDQQT